VEKRPSPVINIVAFARDHLENRLARSGREPVGSIRSGAHGASGGEGPGTISVP